MYQKVADNSTDPPA